MEAGAQRGQGWALPLQAALDDLDQGVSIFDAELRLIAWNRLFIQLLGLPESLVRSGTPYADIVRQLAERGEYGPGDIEEMITQRVRAAERCSRSYVERTSPEGRTLAAQTSPLPTGGFVTVYTDITARGRAEALTPKRSDELEARVNQRTMELRAANAELQRTVRRLEKASAEIAKSEARLRLLCDAIPAAIAYVGKERTLQFANVRFAKLFGRTANDIIGRPIEKIFGKRLWAELSPHVETALGGEANGFEHTYRGLDGKEVITRNTLVPEWVDGPSVRGLFVLSLDVTEERKAARAMNDAQKMSAIGQLAGGLAHDFNNLLTVILGNMSSLHDRIDASLADEFIEPALRAGRRGADITRRLLTFARQQSLEPLPVDVPRLLGSIVQLLRRSLPGNVSIECTTDEGGWPAQADPAQLENAIINLALNARDAMPTGGVLTLHTSYAKIPEHGDTKLQPGDYVEVSVIDTGIGIAPEVRARMFEPFFTTKPFGRGNGLGLSMVFGFAQQSGGDVRIESELGVGTRVTLLLPRAHGAVAVESAAPDDVGPIVSDEQLVLLVEDDEDVRSAIRRQLLELGYRVLEARDSEDARALLWSVQVSALVSDVVLPGVVDGIGLADLAREKLPDIKIVLISGFAGFSVSASRYDWFDERLVVHKPFSKDQLARALQRSAR
jgi:PAS domain S-box-containing protein